jgi:hypothetical protein
MFLPDGRSFELSRQLLRGAIDIHVHAGPHIFSSPRRVDPFEAAVEARDAGMRAIVFMDVFEMSNGTAWLVNRQVPDFTTYGGLIMNTVYGGMNPRAVKTALSYGDGAKYVSFGAHSTYDQASREGQMVDGRFVPSASCTPSSRSRNSIGASASRSMPTPDPNWTRSCRSSPSIPASTSTPGTCRSRKRSASSISPRDTASGRRWSRAA